ncbi:DgyrCDS9514 [Dimorphilus gyrociliatus]|uniref:DgyrCDS9514 n=1 Tax=Dimorphilus gyrociliatus TaxID=2664684 RepID=A0A7I8VYN8_9ANNE|nr:DgyrCDS9514 [Dimorphilus gyrociliatus]
MGSNKIDTNPEREMLTTSFAGIPKTLQRQNQHQDCHLKKGCCNFKVIVVGESGIGKTTFVYRFVTGEFINFLHHSVSFSLTDSLDHTIAFDGYNIHLDIWDTAGQERYRSLTGSYYRGAGGCLLCFDRTDETTFNHLCHWYDDIKKYAPKSTILLVGLKTCSTKEDAVDKFRIERFASEYNLNYVKVDSERGKSVDHAFRSLVEGMCQSFLLSSNKRVYNSLERADSGYLSLVRTTSLLRLQQSVQDNKFVQQLKSSRAFKQKRGKRKNNCCGIC